MVSTRISHLEAAPLLLLLLFLATTPCHSFCVRPLVVRHKARAVARWYRDDHQDENETPDWIEQEKRLFDHDDWVEYRKNSDQTAMDVFWTLFGLFTGYLLVVAILM